MTANDVNDIKKQAAEAICGGSLAFAFTLLRQLSDEAAEWKIASRLDDCSLLYSQMLIYRYRKAEDPDREKYIHRLRSDMLSLLDDLCEMLFVRYSSSYEYMHMRIFGQKHTSLADTCASLRHHAPSPGAAAFSPEFESLISELFECLWLGGRWTDSDEIETARLMADEDMPLLVRTVAISALTLSLLRRYDPRKISFLFSLYGGTCHEIKARVAISLLLVIARHHDMLLTDEKNMSLLSCLIHGDDNISDLEYAYTQIVRTSENKRITDKIMTDIMPEMMKASAKVKHTMQEDDDDMLNPKWQDMLEDSGIADKLREFSELQLKGADVYVSTFAPLKSFPFFRHISRWFLPFDRRMTGIAHIFSGDASETINILAANPQLCNSDKYSFFLSIAQMPQNRLAQMQAGLAEQLRQMKEDDNSERWQAPAVTYKLCVRQYVQDLYRFYNLFPQHKDFPSPLEEALQLYKSPVYTMLFHDIDIRRRLCEFFFEKDCYAQAKEMYRTLSKETVPDVAFYQKLGFACYKTGEYLDAIEAYSIADTLQPDDLWTLNAIAKNYKLLGDSASYLAYLEKIYALDSENGKVIFRLADLYISLGRHADASRLLFKLDYLTPGQPKVLRALVEALVNIQEFEKAMTYLTRLAGETRRTGLIERRDLLYMGHLCKRIGQDDEAMRCYYRLLAMTSRDVPAFSGLMTDGRTIALFGLDRREMEDCVETAVMIPETKLFAAARTSDRQDT